MGARVITIRGVTIFRFYFMRYGLLVWLMLVGCAQDVPPDPTAVLSPPASPSPTVTETATQPPPTTTPSPTATPSPSHTPSPTPTPTATAVSLRPSGDPRTGLLRDPIPHSRNMCGVIDVLDFPIDPPHAARVSRGGSDFGVFRSRFGKFHAGEDWGGPAGQPNLGTAVYSIGHGVVTYAQPLGWGRDQGVVIVQHNYADGTPVLSFYGHLAPESVVLQGGDCVARGDLVGQIGQPRSSPHLHFEVRTQAPYATLTGYWPDDPTTQGWLPPSQYIWAQRLAATPGVVWVQPPVEAQRFTSWIGALSAEMGLLLAGNQLVGVDLTHGRVTNPNQPFPLPERDPTEPTTDALMQGNTLFVANGRGEIHAYDLPDLRLRWVGQIERSGRTHLLPHPLGGVLVTTPNQLHALDGQGERLWQMGDISRPVSWVVKGDALFFTTGGTGEEMGLWHLRGEALPVQLAPVGGKLALAGEQVWLYSEDALYLVEPQNEREPLTRQLALPTAVWGQSDMVALPHGGVLLVHRDAWDSRLLFVGQDGLVWERSIANLGGTSFWLQVVGERVFLVMQTGQGQASDLFLYEVGLAPAGLQQVLHGGTRTAVLGASWVTAVANPDLLLLNIGGGHLVAFAP